MSKRLFLNEGGDCGGSGKVKKKVAMSSPKNIFKEGPKNKLKRKV